MMYVQMIKVREKFPVHQLGYQVTQTAAGKEGEQYFSQILISNKVNYASYFLQLE